MMSKRPDASSSRGSSAAQLTAINRGTRLPNATFTRRTPAGLTVRAGSSAASAISRLQSRAPVLPSYLRPTTFTIAPAARSSSSSAIRRQHNPLLLRSQSLSLPRYANNGAGTGRTTWPPCPWTKTSSSFSTYYYPTPKSHSQPSVDDDVMTCSSFAWTMLEDDSSSTKSSTLPSFYDLGAPASSYCGSAQAVSMTRRNLGPRISSYPQIVPETTRRRRSNEARAPPPLDAYYGNMEVYGHPPVPGYPKQQHLLPGATRRNTLPNQDCIVGYPTTRFDFDQAVPNTAKATTQMRGVSRRWRPIMCWGCGVSC